MKSLFSIVFSMMLFAEAMVPSMETLELAKLPALIEHYQKHKAENPSMSFQAFVRMHYENSPHHEQDPQTHHDLPFGNHHQHNCNIFQLFLTVPDLSLVEEAKGTTEKNTVEYQPPATITFYASIWQPPRLS